MEAHGIMKAFPKVKRSKVADSKNAPPPKKKVEEVVVTGTVFQGVSVHILPAGIGKARCDIFQRQVTQNGGKMESALGPGVTHVVVEDTMDRERALRLLKVDTLPSSAQLVKCSWLSACISEKRLLDTTGHSLLLPERNKPVNNTDTQDRKTGASTAKPALLLKHDVPSVHEGPSQTEGPYRDEDGVTQSDLDALMGGHHPDSQSSPDYFSTTPTTTATPSTDATATAPTSADPSQAPGGVPGKWVCAQSSEAKGNNHNKHLTDKLDLLAKAYTHKGDRWRSLSYSKAVNALKSYHKPVTSHQEACQIPGIGQRMADKIMEIMEDGHLRKLDRLGDDVPVLEVFTNIWGVGAKTAHLWYQLGYRTLEDVRTKASLTHTQQIGLKHYDDFLERMPREEAAAIEKTVREAAHAVDPGLVAVACGSYRRGKATCGDVDVLITHPDGHSHKGVFSKVLHILHESGFLTDDLVSHEENGEQKKYMGVCRLPDHVTVPGRPTSTANSIFSQPTSSTNTTNTIPGQPTATPISSQPTSTISAILVSTNTNTSANPSQTSTSHRHRHRRLDVIVVPFSEFACALLYFTGSAHFNRSMRALCKTKRMSLSEHSLNRDVVRQGSTKLAGGTPVPTPSEKDVFALLGVPYREPHQRDW
ncbi:DNA polymerase lambda isoform X2 [Engraulis encrasicolus]|uniref:DNA polymerase lambda isoform X2 n=1 Tax=Engraulis encrasicolus TaxID=184585 RepID=UPI002FD56A4F